MAEWFEGLPADDLAAATNNGWNKPAAEVIGAIFKSQRSAHSVIGSDPAAIIKLPKDATDPSYAGIYERVVGLGLPKSADEYKFDGIAFKDGSSFEDADAAFIRSTAAKNKLTAAQARGIAADLAAHLDAANEADAGGNATAKAVNDAALKTAWALDYDRNAAGAATVLDAFKAMGMQVMTEGLDAAAHVKQMTALFNLSQQLKEHPMLRGGMNMTPPATAMTREEAEAKFNERRNDTAWINKALNESTSAEAQELHNLQAYMSGITPDEFTAFKQGKRIERRG